jgi:nucleotide-binding universal stress UspA family protein
VTDPRVMGGRLVVGVDGSESATSAVRWAAREANLRGAKLELVSVWEVSVSSVGYGLGFAEISGEMLKGLEQNAEEILATAAEVAREGSPEIEIETRTVEGHAADVLVRAARDADLLVVGSRGMGGFRELLLGSVSQQCAHHATCPVVIVRHVDPAA